jgi:hypothetical protein
MKTLYVQDDDHKKVKTAAAKSRLTMSETVSALIRAGLKQVREGKLKLTK